MRTIVLRRPAILATTLAAGFCTIFLFQNFAYTENRTMVIGVNEMTIARTNTWDSKIKDIGHAGFGGLRMQYQPHLPDCVLATCPYEQMMSTLALANQRGIRTLIMVPLTLSIFYAPETPRRPKERIFISMHSLSKLSPDLVEKELVRFIEDLKSRGLKVDAIQLGNEINSTMFNADFKIRELEEGRLINEANYSVWYGPEYAAFKNTLNKTAAIGAALKKAYKRVFNDTQMKLIAPSLTKPSSWYIRESGMTVLDLPFAMKMMQWAGMDDVFDSYAIHVYPAVDSKSDKSSCVLLGPISVDQAESCTMDGSVRNCVSKQLRQSDQQKDMSYASTNGNRQS